MNIKKLTLQVKRNLACSGLLISMATAGFMGNAAAADNPILGMNAPERIVGEYIVVFKDEPNLLANYANSNAFVNKVLNDIQSQIGGQVQSRFSKILKGASMRLAENELNLLAKHPMVKYIEANKTVSLNEVQYDATWGIDRIDQRDLPLDQEYHYGSTGENAHVFILDTGIRKTHQEFTGRVGEGKDFVDNDNTPQDCHGHGTHVAGTAAGTTYGVAKEATIHAVRVLDCQGSGSFAGIMDGLEWVSNAGHSPAVINMSLGGSSSQSLNDAVRNVVDAGIPVVVAAGNDSSNACNYSPAGEPTAITVGSTTSSDKMSSFSNSGTCVDIFAPGSGITSASNSSDTGSTSMNGTSMASPHVAGAAAIYLGDNPNASPQDVVNHLTSTASEGKISGLGSNSPNLLLHVEGTPQGLEADFTYSNDDKTVSFQDKSKDDVGVSSWSWNFGDGSTSSQQNPTHEYADYGTYKVTLTVTDDDGNEDTISDNVVVSDKSEFELENGVAKNDLSGNKDDVVHYFINVPAGATNLVVKTSANNGDADLYLKQGSKPSMNDYDCRPYNGGSNETCTVDSPVAGTYYVMIHAYSAYDNLTLTASYDGEPDGPNADFEPTVNGLTVEFKDKSTGAESWSWNFGDGKNSNSQNPSHTYSKAGTYSVELTVTDADGNSDTATQSVTVSSDTPDDNCSSAWSGSTWYSAGDVVSYNGNNYEAISSNYNVAPDSWIGSWYWEDLGSCGQ